MDRVLLIVCFGYIIVLGGMAVFYSYQYNNLLKAPLLDGFDVTIHGNVTTTGDALTLYKTNKDVFLNSRPNIALYNSVYNLDLLCGAGNLDYRTINWPTDIQGEYSFTERFNAATSVVITTNCYGCHNQILNISRNTTDYRVDISWDTKECKKDYQIFDNSFQEIQAIELRVPNVQQELDYKNFSNDYRQDVQKDITSTSDVLVNYAKPQSNETLRYLYALRADWYLTRANTKIELYDLERCYNQLLDMMKNYNDSFCYNPDYNLIQSINNINASIARSSWITTTYNDPKSYDETRLEFIRNNIYQIYNEGRYNLNQANTLCINAKTFANDSFQYQMPICQQRKMVFDIFEVSSMSLPFVIGLGIGVLIILWVYRAKKIR